MNSNFFELYGDRIVTNILTHLGFVLASVFLAFIIAFTLGIVLSRVPKYAKIIIPIISVFQTIPGIVFVGLMFIVRGMVPSTIIIALTIYAIFPILKNTYIGIINVDEKYKNSAKGCGMSEMQMLFKVEVPLAMPVIISGLRMSTIYTVSWAVLASMIGLGGLGDFIYTGISTNNNELILAGAIPSALMAVILTQIIDFFERRIISEHLRRDN